MADGKIFFADDAEIVLFGCNQDQIAKEISKILPNATVIGGKGNVYPVDANGDLVERDDQVEVGARAEEEFKVYKDGKEVESRRGTQKYEGGYDSSTANQLLYAFPSNRTDISGDETGNVCNLTVGGIMEIPVESANNSTSPYIAFAGVVVIAVIVVGIRYTRRRGMR
jgi:hypothetical protein